LRLNFGFKNISALLLCALLRRFFSRRPTLLTTVSNSALMVYDKLSPTATPRIIFGMERMGSELSASTVTDIRHCGEMPTRDGDGGETARGRFSSKPLMERVVA
jgi:hypothetical protein